MATTTTAHLKSVRTGVGLIIAGWVGLAIWNLLPPVASIFGVEGNITGAAVWIGVVSVIGLIGGALTLVGNGLSIRATRDVRTEKHIARDDAKRALTFTAVGVVAYVLAIVSAALGGVAFDQGNMAPMIAQLTSAGGQAVTLDTAFTNLGDANAPEVIVATVATLVFGLAGLVFTLAGIFKYQRFCNTVLGSYNDPNLKPTSDNFDRMRISVAVYLVLGAIAIIGGAAMGVASVQEAIAFETAGAAAAVLVGLWYLSLVAVFVFQFVGLGNAMKGLNHIEKVEARPAGVTTPERQRVERDREREREQRERDQRRGAA